jgi:murein DD-endopeptidase MepM/ murein hydrolase activator NlpD
MKRTPELMLTATTKGFRRLSERPGFRRAFLFVLFGGFGVFLYMAGQHSIDLPPQAGRELATLKLDLLLQQGEIDRLQIRNEQTINALAARLAELQAASTRLDALGERLVQMGQLTLDEFDFSEPAPVGGPADNMTKGAASEAELRDAIAALSNRLRRQSSHLDALQSLMMNRQVEEELTPAGWPVNKGWISSRFGERNDPFTGERAQHSGLDFAGTRGTEVMSVASGVVIRASNRGGYGRTVEIEHANGYVTRYAHNDEILVNAGDKVVAGQAIATMGSSGRASAPHVHFEVLRNGSRVNPASFVKQLR